MAGYERRRNLQSITAGGGGGRGGALPPSLPPSTVDTLRDDPAPRESNEAGGAKEAEYLPVITSESGAGGQDDCLYGTLSIHAFGK